MCGPALIGRVERQLASHPVSGLRQQLYLAADDVVHHADDTDALVIYELPDGVTFFEQLANCPNDIPAGHGIDYLLPGFTASRSQTTAVSLRDNPTNLLKNFADVPAAGSD
jgi:hypothetical protein